MKSFLIVVFCLSQVCAAQTPPANPAPKTSASVILGVFDRSTKADYDARVAPILQSEIQGCSDCTVKNYSSYDAHGNFTTDASEAHQLELLAQESNIIFINFNERANATNKVISEALKTAQAAGKLVVFAASQPSPGENSAPLSATLAGQVPGALIIGELGERDRLLGASFFGPEMLTAIRPPKDQIGKGIAPSIFAGRLTKAYHKRTDWQKYLAEKKIANRRIWLELNDCFR